MLFQRRRAGYGQKFIAMCITWHENLFTKNWFEKLEPELCLLLLYQNFIVTRTNNCYVSSYFIIIVWADSHGSDSIFHRIICDTSHT